MDCWNDEIETILDNVRKNAIRLNNYHIKRFYHFKSYGKYFRIPLIFLNSLGSVCSVGLQPYMEQKSISLTTCLIAMLCGLITSLELYLSIQSSMENHLKCAKDFYTLSIDIYKTLELTRDIRGEDGKEYLNKIYAQYQKLMENSQLLKKKVTDDLTFIDNTNTTTNSNTSLTISQVDSHSSLSTPTSLATDEERLNVIA
jgi:hypothetical protein